MRRDIDEHMHVIARKSSIDDGHAQLIADLLDDLAHTEPDVAVQHLVAILRRPNEMIAMMKCCVKTGTIRHRLQTESLAEASIRLKSQGFLPERGDSKLQIFGPAAFQLAGSAVTTAGVFLPAAVDIVSAIG